MRLKKFIVSQSNVFNIGLLLKCREHKNIKFYFWIDLGAIYCKYEAHRIWKNLSVRDQILQA